MLTIFKGRSRTLGAALGATLIVASAACSTEAKIQRGLERADAYLGEGKLQEAVLELRNVLQLDENNAQATEKLALALWDAGQVGSAARFLERAAENDPANVGIRSRLATYYLLGGRTDEAREEARAILGLEPGNLDALSIYAYAAPEDSIQNALDRLEAARGEHGNKAKFHLSVGALRLRARDVAGAEEAFQEAARIEPDSSDAHLALGTFYIGKQDLERAKAEFDLAAAAAPLRSAPQIRVVDFYRLLGYRDEANARLDEIVLEAPDFLPAWQRIARYGLADRDYTRAEHALTQLLEANPRDMESLRLMGEVHLARGEREQATARFREAITILQDVSRRRPELVWPHFRLGEIHARIGEVEQAKTELRRVLELAPAAPEAVLLLAELEIRTGQSQNTIEPLTALLNRRPLPQGYELLGRAHMAQKDAAKAKEAFTKLVELAPKLPRGHHLLGMSLLAQNLVAEGVSEMNEALELDPGYVEPLVVLVSFDVRAKRFDAAIARVRTQIDRLDPSGPHELLLGQVYEAANRLDEAEASYRRAVAIDPGLDAAYARIVGILVRSGRAREGIAELDQALAANEDSVALRMQKGMLHYQLGEQDEAQAAYERLLEVDPNFWPAENNLAVIYQARGRLDEALALAEKARVAAPDNPDIADTLGWILYERGTYERALGLLKEAAAGRPDNADIHFHLGFCHNKLRETRDAVAALRKALALSPDSPFAGEARDHPGRGAVTRGGRAGELRAALGIGAEVVGDRHVGSSMLVPLGLAGVTLERDDSRPDGERQVFLVVDGRAGAGLRRGLFQRHAHDERGLQLELVRGARVPSATWHEVLDESLESRGFLARVLDP